MRTTTTATETTSLTSAYPVLPTSSALSQFRTLSWRGVVKLRRKPMVLADVVIGPAIFLVLFGYVFGGALAGSVDAYLQYVFPGIVAMMTLLATMGVGASLSADLAKGVFDRFRSLPIRRISPLVGAVGSDVIRQLVSLTALFGFGMLLGVRFRTNLWSVLAAVALALVFALAVSWVWVLLAVVIKDPQGVQGLGAVVIFPLAFASNIFIPTDTMPAWLQTFTSWNPVGHLTDTLRALLMGGDVTGPLSHTLAWIAGFVLIFAPLSLFAYHQQT